MMPRYFLCCYLILLLSACNVQQQDHLAFMPPVFPETKQVSVTPFATDFLMNGSYLMLDLGDFIMVGTYHDEKYFHIFEKENFSYIKSFAGSGRGPGEFNGPPIVRLNEDKSELYAMPRYGGIDEFLTYEMEKVLQDSYALPSREEKIVLFKDEGIQYPDHVSDFLGWKDKRLFARDRMYRFEVQYSSGNMLQLYNQYPDICSADSLVFQRSYSKSSLALKPDMSRFVVASSVGCILEIFRIDATGKITKETEKRFIPPIFKATRSGMLEYISGKTIVGIGRFSVTDEFIYAGYTSEIWIPNVSGGLPKTIAVFDWSGNPVRQYILDWKINDIIVDTQRNRCYVVGIDVNDEVLFGYFEL